MAHILVVDDSKTVRREVAEFLSENGFEVITAVDGEDGIEMLQKHPEVKLIISDVSMPNIDGLTMAEKIRNEVGNKEVQILMLTIESNPKMMERGKKAGVKGWIIKPFNGPKALGPIKRFVGI